MADSEQGGCSPNAGAVTPDPVNRIKGYLRRPDIPEQEFNLALDALGETELKLFGFDYFYFNLLSVFGSKLAIEEIRYLAAECNKRKLRSGWEAWRYLFDLERSCGRASPHLHNWNTGMLHDLLSQGRGLIVCTSHFGPFRHIAFDLRIMGFKVSVGMDSESAAQMKNLSAGIPGVEKKNTQPAEAKFKFGNINVIDVEQDRLATLRLLNALRRNEIVVLYGDGNTGFDGPRGKSNRISLSFLGYVCQVKAGTAQLAVLSGAPVVQIFARKDPERQRPAIAMQLPIEIRPALSALDRKQYIAELTRELYRRMEAYILHDPDQWESACLFHRWRAATAVATPMVVADEKSALQILEQSGAVKLKQERVARIDTKEGQLLVDVNNLRTFQIGGRLQPILQKLYDSALSYSCFQQELAEEQRQDVGKLLCKLHSLEWITPA